MKQAAQRIPSQILKIWSKGLIPSSVDEFVKEDIRLTECAITDASRKYITYIDGCSDSSINNGDFSKKIDNDCIACKRHDFPTRAHLCLICHKKVHILPGCSIRINDEEGY